MRIYHLAIDDAWTAAKQAGTYTVSTLGLQLDEVGFIHCSQAEQLVGVHDRFYRAVSAPLRLLTIDTDLLTSPWRLAPVKGEPLPFPHIYGPLNVDAVILAEPFSPSAST